MLCPQGLGRDTVFQKSKENVLLSPLPCVTVNLRVSRAWGRSSDGDLSGWDLVETVGDLSVLDGSCQGVTRSPRHNLWPPPGQTQAVGRAWVNRRHAHVEVGLVTSNRGRTVLYTEAPLRPCPGRVSVPSLQWRVLSVCCVLLDSQLRDQSPSLCPHL